MTFQILNKDNQPLTMNELDKEAAAFWGVELNDMHYAAPQNCHWTTNWFEVVGQAIARLSAGKYGWSDIIGSLSAPAAIGETSYEGYIQTLIAWKPFIELCLHWQAQGYTPVSC